MLVHSHIQPVTVTGSRLACVAAGPRTRQNHLYSLRYTEGLEHLRRSQGRD